VVSVRHKHALVFTIRPALLPHSSALLHCRSFELPPAALHQLLASQRKPPAPQTQASAFLRSPASFSHLAVVLQRFVKSVAPKSHVLLGLQTGAVGSVATIPFAASSSCESPQVNLDELIVLPLPCAKVASGGFTHLIAGEFNKVLISQYVFVSHSVSEH
jgi:hypothetical protein